MAPLNKCKLLAMAGGFTNIASVVSGGLFPNFYTSGVEEIWKQQSGTETEKSTVTLNHSGAGDGNRTHVRSLGSSC